MNGAEAIIKCFKSEGVELVFGYTGVAIAPFFDAMEREGIRGILVRTEQNAAHAASGYARTTHKVGVCAVSSGPGATNLLTGIATAYADSVPLICVTGQVNSELLGSDVFQEADVRGACESFVKYCFQVEAVEDIPRIVQEAFHIANTGRKGPVVIDVPVDIQKMKIRDFDYPQEINIRAYKPTVKGNAVQIKKVLAELKKAKRPLLYAGGGVHTGDAVAELRRFVERHRIPVVSTMMGLSVMPTEHPLYYGMVGNNGKPYANRAVSDADLIIMAGARVADRAVNQPDRISDNKVLVHMDVDPAEIGKNVGPAIPLVGDIKSIFEDMNEQEVSIDTESWIDLLDMYEKRMQPVREPNPDYVDPAEFIRLLSGRMEDDAVYVADVGQNQLWSCEHHIVKDGQFLTSGGMGCMGYSIPAAMGVNLGSPDRQVVALCGDGSFQMSMMELAAIRQHGARVKLVVFNNGYLGLVRQNLHQFFEDRYSMVDLSGSPDIGKIAAAYDIPFTRLTDMDNAAEKIDSFLADKGTAIMECMIDPMDLV